MIKEKLSKLFDLVFLEKNVNELHTSNFCSRQEPFILNQIEVSWVKRNKGKHTECSRAVFLKLYCGCHSPGTL